MTMNLHCAVVEPGSQRFRLAMQENHDKPGAEFPLRLFQIKAESVELVQKP